MSTQKIFFSYSRADSPFALTLAKDLREAGADIWIDQLDIPAGSHWDAAVEKALNSSAYVLVILTPSSTAVSYTHLRAHETVLDLVCRLLLEKKQLQHPHYSMSLILIVIRALIDRFVAPVV